MTILCFLQNMWVREPEKVRAWLEKNPDLWNRAVAGFLFAGCLTGRRIKACFGEDLLEKMTFEECTKEIAGDSRTVCSPDPKHIKACLEKYKPRVVVTFGRVAEEAVQPIFKDWVTAVVNHQISAGPIKSLKEIKISGKLFTSFIACPHPAARQKDTVENLKKAAKDIRDYLPQKGAKVARETR